MLICNIVKFLSIILIALIIVIKQVNIVYNLHDNKIKMKRNRITVIGAYQKGEKFNGGQFVKTVSVVDLLRENNNYKINVINTHKWKLKAPLLFLKVFFSFFVSRHIILMTSYNGVRLFTPLLNFLNVFFGRKIHYIVIGGQIGKLVKKHKKLRKISKFYMIYVETEVMKLELAESNIKNVVVLNNFKNLQKTNLTYKEFERKENLNICFFSRIEPQKGVIDLIDVIKEINKDKVIYNLDIYGFIHDENNDWFFSAIKETPYIKYKGIVDYNESVSVIENYFLQVFPTLYKTEGIPGSIIDSYFAGVPVLSSRWNSFEQVVKENVTGLGFTLGDKSDLHSKLLYCYDNQKVIYDMKKGALEAANYYSKEYFIKTFQKHIK